MISLERLRMPSQKHSNGQTLAYISTYNKNKQELFTERSKNLDQLKNHDQRKKNTNDNKIY